MLIIKAINLVLLAMIFAMPIYFPDTEVREYRDGPKLPHDGDDHVG